ncbi:acyl-homoserine-lactone synthase [Sphingopyxis sp. KK2]|uniref:acyl-homoserine-lactone synthase n=1 Tax=Sphingopyxis sp. KK2 TaxID=1855727 RepID=UPI00097E71E4|nr:acyl-homoserine-lactone synthase [Sphingopyxis sp. KK2]
MLHIVDTNDRTREHKVLRSMFEARKHVFVDLLKWNLPVLAGKFEVDQFDDGHAAYLIVTDVEGNHLASARLLKTTRPALLDSLYPDLVDGVVPSGTDVLEITRFCLSRGVGAQLRRSARDMLLVGLVDYALANKIGRYTGVAEVAWFDQIRRFGWDCEALGSPRTHDGRSLTSLLIRIDGSSVSKLEGAGIVADTGLALPTARAA